eukprot:scaffold112269_cov69-Phaeocystis_antarctica.AAC.2
MANLLLQGCNSLGAINSSARGRHRQRGARAPGARALRPAAGEARGAWPRRAAVERHRARQGAAAAPGAPAIAAANAA